MADARQYKIGTITFIPTDEHYHGSLIYVNDKKQSYGTLTELELLDMGATPIDPDEPECPCYKTIYHDSLNPQPRKCTCPCHERKCICVHSKEWYGVAIDCPVHGEKPHPPESKEIEKLSEYPNDLGIGYVVDNENNEVRMSGSLSRYFRKIVNKQNELIEAVNTLKKGERE